MEDGHIHSCGSPEDILPLVANEQVQLVADMESENQRGDPDTSVATITAAEDPVSIVSQLLTHPGCLLL